jgi:hypothetical protein
VKSKPTWRWEFVALKSGATNNIKSKDLRSKMFLWTRNGTTTRLWRKLTFLLIANYGLFLAV